jgi:hypothetical protein
MNNFIIGTLRENIDLLFHNLHLIQDTIPKKFAHLTDVAGRWNINSNGDIVPESNGTLNIGSIDKSVKSLFLSENSLHIVKDTNVGEKVSVKFGVSEDNSLEITQETLSDTLSDGNLQQVQSNALTVPSKNQLLFSDPGNKILINAIKTIENTSVNFTNIINSSNDNITADTPGTYISPVTQYGQTTIINDNIDIRPMYYNPNTKEMFCSDGSGHFTDLNVSGILKGPAELIIDPAPVSDNAGTVRIKGNLIVDGTQTVINSNVVEIEDNIISIKGSNQVSSGIEIKSDDDVIATFSYEGNEDVWKTNNKDLDIGNGKLIVQDISVSSIGKILLDGTINTDEVIDINVNDILTDQNVNVETGIISVSLVDKLSDSGSTGIYLVSKIYNNFFYTVLLEKNTGLSNISFASETGLLTIKGNNQGVSFQIKILNISKILN